MKLLSKETKYVCSPDDIKRLIADNLKVPLQSVSVRYVIEEIG